MDLQFKSPAKGETATWEEFETALRAVDWSFHETEEEEAVASYVKAKEIETVLLVMYGGTNPHNIDKDNMNKIYSIWNKHAPAGFRY